MRPAVSSNQGVVHLQWKDRTTGDMGMDLEVFPGDGKLTAMPLNHFNPTLFRLLLFIVEIKRITTPDTSDRVYELRLTHGSRREFFWAQEAKEALDKAATAKLVQVINDPTMTASASTAPSRGLALPGGLTAEMVSQMLSSLEVGGRVGASASSAAPDSRSLSASTPASVPPATTTVPPSAAFVAQTPTPVPAAATVNDAPTTVPPSHEMTDGCVSCWASSPFAFSRRCNGFVPSHS